MYFLWYSWNRASTFLNDGVYRNNRYNKGVLAEILEDIMGKGLIPADPVTWKVRRRAIVPAFHKKWLAAMVGLFGDCTERLVDDFDRQVRKRGGGVIIRLYSFRESLQYVFVDYRWERNRLGGNERRPEDKAYDQTYR